MSIKSAVRLTYSIHESR